MDSASYTKLYLTDNKAYQNYLDQVLKADEIQKANSKKDYLPGDPMFAIYSREEEVLKERNPNLDSARKDVLSFSNEKLKDLITPKKNNDYSDSIIYLDLKYIFYQLENDPTANKVQIAELKAILDDPEKREIAIRAHHEFIISSPETMQAWRERLAKNNYLLDSVVQYAKISHLIDDNIYHTQRVFMALPDETIKNLIKDAPDQTILKDLNRNLSKAEQEAPENLKAQIKEQVTQTRELLKDPTKSTQTIALYRETLLNNENAIKAWRISLSENKVLIDQAVKNASTVTQATPWPDGVVKPEDATSSAKKFISEGNNIVAENILVPTSAPALDITTFQDRTKKLMLGLSDQQTIDFLADRDTVLLSLNNNLSQAVEKAPEGLKAQVREQVAQVKERMKNPQELEKLIAEYRQSLIESPATLQDFRNTAAENPDLIIQAIETDRDRPSTTPVRDFLIKNIFGAGVAGLEGGSTAAYVAGSWGRNPVTGFFSYFGKVKNTASAVSTVTNETAIVVETANVAKGAIVPIVEEAGIVAGATKPLATKLAPGMVYIAGAYSTYSGGSKISEGVEKHDLKMIKEGSEEMGGGVGTVIGGVTAGTVTTAIIGTLTAPAWLVVAPVAIVGAAIGAGSYYLGRRYIGQIIDDSVNIYQMSEHEEKRWLPDKEGSHFRNTLISVLEDPTKCEDLAVNCGVARDERPAFGGGKTISIATIEDALLDPKRSPYVLGRLKAYIPQLKDKENLFLKMNDDFPDSVANNSAKFRLGVLEAAEKKIDGVDGGDRYVADLKRRHENWQAEVDVRKFYVENFVHDNLKKDYLNYKEKNGDAALDEKTYIKVMSDYIINARRKAYPAYEAKIGEHAMTEDYFIFTGVAATAGRPDIIAKLEEVEKSVQYLTSKQYPEWAAQHPGKTVEDLLAQNRHDITDETKSETLKAAILQYEAADRQAKEKFERNSTTKPSGVSINESPSSMELKTDIGSPRSSATSYANQLESYLFDLGRLLLNNFNAAEKDPASKALALNSSPTLLKPKDNILG